MNTSQQYSKKKNIGTTNKKKNVQKDLEILDFSA